MRIFLSYGHDEHAATAERLKSELQHAGHEVWFDLDRLRPGADWEHYIEEGLEWASVDLASSRFVLLMTPHSVRRPNGFCLRELARAMNRQLTIVPVMLATCEPPLSIANLQWLDMRDAAAAEYSDERFHGAAGQLARALETKAPAFDSTQERLLRRLDPDEFRHEIAAHSAHFVGRGWVDQLVDRWLNSPDADRVLWLTAPPGFGKTALAVHLFSVRPDVAALYVCVHGNSRKTDPRHVVTTIAYQLTTQLPDYRTRVNQLPLEDLTSQANAAALFDSFIAQPLATLPPPRAPVLVIVDALDEATTAGENPLAQLIATEFSRAPMWLRFLVTSRPDEPAITFPLQALNPVPLDADANANAEDLRQFVGDRLRHQRHPPIPAVVDAIVAKSEGLFLYVVLWLDAVLESGQTLTMERVAEFPQGLAGVYAHFFKRQFADVAAYKTQWRPVLEVLVDASDPLPLDTLARLFNWSEYDLAEMPAALGSLFPVSDSRIHPFHRSVIDWIANAAKAGPYFVRRGNGHRRLADAGWDDYVRGAERLSDYFVRFLPIHLAANEDWTRLAQLLMDPSFTRRMVDANGYEYLRACYERWPIAAALPDGHEQWLCRMVVEWAEHLKRFRGRRAETSRVENALGVPGAAVLVLGRGGVGKTSFLWHLRMRDFRRRLFVGVNSFEQSLAEWLQVIGEAISERVAGFDPALLHTLADDPDGRSLEASLRRTLGPAMTLVAAAGFDTLLLDPNYGSGDTRVVIAPLMHAARRAGLNVVVACHPSVLTLLGDVGEWTTQLELPAMSLADIKSAIEEMLARHPPFPEMSADGLLRLFPSDTSRQPDYVLQLLGEIERVLFDRPGHPNDRPPGDA